MSDYIIARPAGDVLDYHEVGAVNGIAKLNGSAQLETAQVPTSIAGIMAYQGTWNATTNIPAIPAASSANNGWYYIVATAGSTSVDGLSYWRINDMILSNGTIWEMIDNNAAVADEIVNGVTNVAPSENAVFDALAGKADTGHTHLSADISAVIAATNLATPDSIAKRDASGNARFVASAAVDDVVVKSEIAAIPAATALATPSTLVKRDVAGRTAMAPSSVASDAVIKADVIGYVEFDALDIEYNLLPGDNIIGVTATATIEARINLPLPSLVNEFGSVIGKTFTIKDEGNNAAVHNILLVVPGGVPLNGVVANQTFVTSGGTINLYSTGAGWYSY
jgi:hypothetical protein